MMSVSQKRAPSVEDPQLNRTMSKIYDDINDIVNAVNLGETSIEKDEFEGKSGDLKLVKTSDGNYQIRGRTDEGWVFAAMKPSLKVDSGNDGQFCIQFSGPQSAIADAAAAGTLADLAAAEAKIDLLKDKINTIIASLETAGLLKT